MLRRESGQILPGLIMLMLAILAIGMLTFTIGKAAVLRSGAQTAADAAALAGAGSIKDQLLAQMATTGTADFSRVSEPLVRAAAARYAEKNGGRLVDMKMEGADVRAWVTTKEKLDPPEEETKGKAEARARVELATFQSLGVNFGGGGGALGGGTGNVHITDKEWKELEKKLHKPLDCPDMRVLADFFKAHGAIPPYENVYMGDPPMAPGGERKSTSRHYACENSGAIDLNYPQGIEAGVIEEVRPHLIKLGFFTMWQVENHFDHMHVDFGGGVSPTPGSPLGAAGSLTDSFLQVKLVDWNAPSATGLGAGFVGGAGGIPFGPPDPRVANALCQELDRFNVSALVRLAAWETAIVESGVKTNLPTNDGTSLGPFQQIDNGAWGTAEQRLDPHHSAAAFIRAAEKIEHRYNNAGVLAQAVQGSAYPDRYGQRAGQAASLNDKFCGK